MVLLPLAIMPDLGREGPALLLLLLLEVGRAGQEGGDLVLGLLLRRRVGVPDEVVLEQRLRRVRRPPVLKGGGLHWSLTMVELQTFHHCCITYLVDDCLRQRKAAEDAQGIVSGGTQWRHGRRECRRRCHQSRPPSATPAVRELQRVLG